MIADGTYDEAVLETTQIGRSLGTDYFGLRDELTEDERKYLDSARAFVDVEVLPVINGYWERAEFPWELIKKMGELGFVGDGIEADRLPADESGRGRTQSTWSSTVGTGVSGRSTPCRPARRCDRSGCSVPRSRRIAGCREGDPWTCSGRSR